MKQLFYIPSIFRTFMFLRKLKFNFTTGLASSALGGVLISSSSDDFTMLYYLKGFYVEETICTRKNLIVNVKPIEINRKRIFFSVLSHFKRPAS